MTDNLNGDSILTGNGHRNTRKRRAVIKALSESGKPVTAEEIYLSLINSGDSVCISTVYRTLDFLFSENIIKKMRFNDNESACYEINRNEHSHKLVCRGCRKTISLDVCPLSEFEDKLKKETLFNITGHNLEIFGYCPDCNSESSLI
jgi:Fur family ferric uptake transcriptional regulator